MTNIFYFIIIFPILWELSVLLEPIRAFSFVNSIPDSSKYENTILTNKQSKFVLYNFGYMVYCIVGCFSSNWPLFLVLFIAGGFSKKNIIWFTIDSALSLAILMFIVFNKCYLHFNFSEILYNIIIDLIW